MNSLTQNRPPVQPKPARGVARLTLTVNGVAYGVRPLAAAAFGATRAFRLRKADGTAYDVAETEHGHQCDCPDWTYRRDGIDPSGCKHIKSLVAVGLLVKGGV